MSYCLHRKKLSDDAENNTAIAFADSNYRNPVYMSVYKYGFRTAKVIRITRFFKLSFSPRLISVAGGIIYL